MNFKGARQEVKKLALETIRQIQSIKADSNVKIDRQTIKSLSGSPSAQTAERQLEKLASALSSGRKSDSLYWSRYVRGEASPLPKVASK
ncbi:MAG: hypothetical protein LBE49_07400 [Deltaproteobacteria bacterium]|nr:hypothetical protein [Deltaproteobacteria bacterium]